MFVVIGTTTADVLVHSRSPVADTGADGFRSANVVFTETPVRLSLGGNGAISAYVLAGLGAPVALCSAVGGDPFGRELLDRLTARAVDVTAVARHDGDATSTSVILFSDAASQIVYHHVGATAQIRLDDSASRLLADADVLLASGYPLMTGLRGAECARALASTHESGGITAVDIGPAIGTPVRLGEVASLLPHTDFLLGNTHELCRLTGRSDWESAVADLLGAGARNLIVKRGHQGAAIRGSGSACDVPGFGVPASVSVGAGDAFNAGFLFGVHRGLPLERAVLTGNAVAALLVSAKRGVLDAPTGEQVESFLASGA
jgi:sugar/nucleoside kinase (ribokinase family)